MSPEEEQQLVGRVLAGERAAIVTFYEHYKRIIYKTIRSYAFVSDGDVEDQFHRFFERLMADDWQRLRSWRMESRLSSYLVTLARNSMTDQYRRQRPTLNDDTLAEMHDSSVEDQEQALSRKQLEREMTDAIDELPEREQDIVRRILDGSESREEIAASLGMNTNALYQAFNRAQKRLIRSMREKHPYLFSEPM